MVKKTMRLVKNEPVKVGDGYFCRVTATVRDGKQLVEGERVTFSIDGGKDTKTEETNSQGIASVDLSFAVGGHYVCATLEDGTTHQLTFAVKEEARSNKPTKLIINTVGDNGEYVITVTVLSERGPVKDATVRLSCDVADPKYRDEKTDELGVYTTTDPIRFEDRELFIVISVLGTDLKEELRLNGPRPVARS